MKRLLRTAATVITLTAATVLTGCATNPVTGKNELRLFGENWELQTGAQQYAPSRQSQGGDYEVDPGVQAYVSEVGQRIAEHSDRKLPYEFTVLNNSVPNAWALPGGKIAINRGLLTELDSEAELAAVLGHEIVHAAAGHGAQGAQRGVLLQGAVLGAAVAASGSRYSNLATMGASVGAQLINTKYGRDAERESDKYGMEYMSEAGYDPQAAVSLQETFVRLSEGRNQDFLSGLFASHPPSQERVKNNREKAAELPPGGDIGADRYHAQLRTLFADKEAYEAYDKAQKALADGDTKTARSLAQQAIRLQPREGHFHSLLGDIEASQKNRDAAVRRYTDAIARNDQFFYYYLRRGLLNEELNRDTQARQDLERSIELFPTANAYNALGDLSLAARDVDSAKKYYSTAAGSDSPAGLAARESLLDLDFPANPGQYLQLRQRVNADGSIDVQIANPTGRDVTGLTVGVNYIDASGKARTTRQDLKGTLSAGQSTVVKLAVAVDPAQANRVATAITAAQLAPRR
ncbi:MAG: M48 family metalloprotease [Gammaproteobacteria bacterium]|nr:M48 family metalloprotease [Gammaproteobacteria bacterium]